MKQDDPISGARRGAKVWPLAIAAALLAAPALPASAATPSAPPSQPPWDGCRPASKVEYNAAKQQYLLTTRVGVYIRTGRPWHRYYWYCHP